jgi:hypothetical protein
VITVTVTASRSTRALVDVELYGPAGKRIGQKAWTTVTFTGGAARTLRWSWYASSTRKVGKYTIKVGVFAPGWGRLQSWNNRAGTLRVVR